MTRVEELLLQQTNHHAEQRGKGGSQILNGSGASATVPAGKHIIAIEPIGTTMALGTVVGNCTGLSGFTLPVKAVIYGTFQSVTVGAASTDVFIVYFSL